MKLPKFLLGLIIGGMFAVIFWYWQKSTSAEDGALSVLDRLAASEARVRDLEAQKRGAAESVRTPPPTGSSPQADVVVSEDAADDLQEIEGIGPTYASRLQDAGITSFVSLAQETPEQVMKISGARSLSAVKGWIAAAQVRARS